MGAEGNPGNEPLRRPSLRRFALVLTAVWILVAVVHALPDRSLGTGTVDLDQRAAAVQNALHHVLDDARKIAASALVTFPPTESASPDSVTLRQRLEGIGILDPDGEYLIWQGSPADPPAGFLDPDGDDAWILERGARSRLIVRGGPDAEGWRALASFRLATENHPEGLAELLPPELLAGTQTAFSLSLEASDESPYTWVAAGGRTLARFSIAADTASAGARRLRKLTLALALLISVCGLALLPRWSARLQTHAGLAQALLAIVVGRWLLGWADTAQWLLDREASSASLFGVRTLGDFLASPIDLVLSCVALYLIALALRTRLIAADLRQRAATRWIALALTLLGVIGCGRLVVIVADNSRESLLDGAGEWLGDARLLIATGLILALLAVATIASLLVLRRALQRPGALVTLLPTALCFSALALATAFVLQQHESRAQLEHLRVDLGPEVLEQSTRRELALSATLRQVQQAFADPSTTELALPSRELAFHYWSDSALAHGGFQSSLDFYDLNLDHLSHFGYDVPELFEEVGPLELLLPDAATEVQREPFQPAPSVRQHLMHAEAPLLRDGEVRGVLVAHVLDEPENLPFLPAGRAYLAALGQQREERAAELHYVVYDAQGTPLRSTLVQPPAESGKFRLAALDGKPVRFRVEEEAYVGIALGERDRLHLLLVRDPAALERFAGALRFLLAGLVVVFLVVLVPQLLRHGGPQRLGTALRGSFQRKLVAALLVASVVPLIGLSLILRGYIQSRADEELSVSAVRYASAAQKLLEDATAPAELADDDTDSAAAIEISDSFLLWLRRVVGQDVHVYERGVLVASSKRELFDAGVLPRRLDGWVQRQITLEGRPSLVLQQDIGGRKRPVAYASIRSADSTDQRIVAVPIVRELGEFQRESLRVGEIILVATVVLAALLIVAATYLARTVARPLRALAAATSQIAAGDYGTRLETQTHDEVADLVRGFNAMAQSLKQQRATLERRREYIEALLRHATTGVLSIDAAGTIVTLNPTATTILATGGATIEIGANLERALERATPLAGMRALLRDGAGRPGEPSEFDLDRATGAQRLRMVRVPLPGEENRPVGTLILLDDVTELKRSNQLAAWAEMAQAIAHEIKNPLTPIQLSAEHLQRLLTDRGVIPDEKIEACIETVIKQVRTLYEIAGEFSTYAKLPALKPEPYDPAEFMRETVSPYRNSGLVGIALDEAYDTTLGPVAIDYRVLSRAVVNLVENALQAMPDGGTLHLSVQRHGEGFIEIGVRDSGVGLDAEVRRRLFEPYFSTKSSGTGLGLAIVQRAVEAHQGTIEVQSTPGDGTWFQIRLPLLRQS